MRAIGGRRSRAAAPISSAISRRMKARRRRPMPSTISRASQPTRPIARASGRIPPGAPISTSRARSSSSAARTASFSASSRRRTRRCGALESGPLPSGSRRGGGLTPDPTAAEDALAIVEDAGLARRHGARRLVENDFAAGAREEEPGGHGGLRRAQLHGDAQPVGPGGPGAVAAEPVDGAEPHPATAERALRPDDDARPFGIETKDVERIGRGDAEAAALADGEVDDAVVAAEDAALAIDDLARRKGAGAQLLDEAGIGAARHEADILTVGLGGNRQGEALGEGARLRLAHAAQGKAQEGELIRRRAEEEIALVALGVGSAVQLRSRPPHDAPCVVAGGERIGAEVARGRQEVAELDRLVAAHARDRCFAAQIGIGEIVDDGATEALLVIENVMRDAEALGDARGIANVGAGAARALAPDRRAVVIELQGDADHLEDRKSVV